MSGPVISTCSGISWPACAICACATCCACAASIFVNVNNDAEPIRVASLDVVGFTVTPRCQTWHSFVETKIFRTSRHSEAGSLSLSPVFQFFWGMIVYVRSLPDATTALVCQGLFGFMRCESQYHCDAHAAPHTL